MSSTPSLGVFMATQGRYSLERALHSIRSQKLQHGDEVLVVTDGKCPAVEKMVQGIGPPFRCLEGPKTRDWGHTQCNMAMRLLHTDFIVGQDDDDIFAPRAFEAIRPLLSEHASTGHVFRYASPAHNIIPEEAASSSATFDGHCFVIPTFDLENVNFDHTHAGDQHFKNSIVDKFGMENLQFHEEIISIGRPGWALWDWPVHTTSQVEAMRVIRNACREAMTHFPNHIDPEQQQRWWESVDHDNTWAYLYTDGPYGSYMGYSLIRRKDGKMYVSYGLAPEARGRHLGTELVEHCLTACQGDAHGDLKESNAAIWHIDQKLGFVEDSRQDGIITCHRPWPRYRQD